MIFKELCYGLWLGVMLSSAVACQEKGAERGKTAATFHKADDATFALVVHGGAGYMEPGRFTAAEEKAYIAGLETALRAGYDLLQKGGTAVDAVEKTISILEDNPLFNAGKGAVQTADGRITLDASIMDGATSKAGAVAAVRHIQNPIAGARAVMDKTKHVLLVGEGADAFAKANGLRVVDSTYFYTDGRGQKQQPAPKSNKPDKHGTVGAVALDLKGNLAAGTSTGGMEGKLYGRVGDSPLIGAGTYANNATCAVSCTGHGEFFIRNVVAYDVAALMEYRAMTLLEAAEQVVNVKLKERKADGGLIALDRQGNMAMPFNTTGMFRGYIGVDGIPHVSIYR